MLAAAGCCRRTFALRVVGQEADVYFGLHANGGRGCHGTLHKASLFSPICFSRMQGVA